MIDKQALLELAERLPDIDANYAARTDCEHASEAIKSLILALNEEEDRARRADIATLAAVELADTERARANEAEKERPQFEGVPKRKLDDLLSRGWTICGYAIAKDHEFGLVTTGSLVGWFSVAEENARKAEIRAEAAEAQIVKLREALSLAGHRLNRLSVDHVPNSARFVEVAQWADEALAVSTVEGGTVAGWRYVLVNRELAEAHCDRLDSSLESYWCTTSEGSDDRLLAEDAQDATNQLRAMLAAPAQP